MVLGWNMVTSIFLLTSGASNGGADLGSGIFYLPGPSPLKTHHAKNKNECHFPLMPLLVSIQSSHYYPFCCGTGAIFSSF
jgi:hypothetical protein